MEREWNRDTEKTRKLQTDVRKEPLTVILRTWAGIFFIFFYLAEGHK